MLIPVILSGGAGTRLWPLSRELYPKQLLATPVIFDGRNLYDPHMVESFGLSYYAIGRGRSLRFPQV